MAAASWIPRVVSAVIPTYHRPRLLEAAVSSVLEQEVPAGWRLEVVVALSDPRAADDRAAAEAMERRDPRVRHVEADGRGAGPARNAGMWAATGEVLAFLDDDCVARPGWLGAGMAALERADLVQGRTVPERLPGRFDRFVWITGLDWTWEACNLFVRRDLADRVPEGFRHPAGTSHHIGEDVVFGWQVVRAGARIAFAGDAEAVHVVEASGVGDYLRRRLRLRFFPLLIREAPELRRRFPGRYFLNRRHIALAAAVGLGASAAALHRAGADRAAVAALVLAMLAYPSGWRGMRTVAGVLHDAVRLPGNVALDLCDLAVLAYGSLRYRRVLI